jgi:flagellar protein FlaG
MSIQSLNGFAGGTPQAAVAPGGNPAPIAAAAPNVPPPSPEQQTAPPSQQQVSHAIERIKAALPPDANSLQFSQDNQTGKTIVKVVDTQTGELIRQIPSEEFLRISQAVDKLQGLLLKQSV